MSAGATRYAPETLLKSLLLMVFYAVRSERQLCERLQYDLLFRFFLDMGIEEDAFGHSTFMISKEHFMVDGALIEAWASMRSVRPKDEKPEDRPPPDDRGNPTVNFRGERRRNETHGSTTDPEALLAREGEGKEAKLCFSGHVMMENRNGITKRQDHDPLTLQFSARYCHRLLGMGAH